MALSFRPPISLLDERSAYILSSVLGIGDGAPRTQGDIARTLHLSTQRISQIEKRAIRHLKLNRYAINKGAPVPPGCIAQVRLYEAPIRDHPRLRHYW